MNGNVAATATGELPTIHMPGDEKFVSYKNTLQGYCQKMHLPVPQYKAEKENNGLLGTVTFSSSHVRCVEISGSVKEADSRAAYQALRQLGYLKGLKFEMVNNQLKRKGNKEDNAGSNAKQMRPGIKHPHVTSKSQLNQYAQKERLTFPTYVVVDVKGGFLSTVTINNKQFKGLGVCKKRKDAEQNSAQVALSSLVGAPLPTIEPIDTSDTSDVTKNDSKAGSPVPLKNRLQEYCQRQCKSFPTYDTQFLPDTKTYQAVVNVHGIQYRGADVKGKRNAERAAAEVALKSLELLA